MKNLKLSFALIVAILAVGATIATKANVFGKRAVTRCFIDIQLRNASGSATFDLDQAVIPAITCDDARNQLVLTPYVSSGTVASSLPDELTCPDQEIFCCAKVTEILPSDPEYASAPFVTNDLGDGLGKKYKVVSANIFCQE